jgi:ParB-like chromosome segregation protein Spo0J
VKDGDCEPIKLSKNHFGELKIIDGKVRLLAHKLLGIEPIFEII